MLDRANLASLCHPCHAWLTDHPDEAEALGFRISRFDYVPSVDDQPAIVLREITPDPDDPDPF